MMKCSLGITPGGPTEEGSVGTTVKSSLQKPVLPSFDAIGVILLEGVMGEHTRGEPFCRIYLLQAGFSSHVFLILWKTLE